MKKSVSLLLVILLLAVCALPVSAAVDMDDPQVVVDDAQVLPSALEERIREANEDLAGSCSGACFTVVTVEYAPDGLDHEEFAKNIFNTWGIGSASENNGMLLVVYTEDDSFWLEVGAGIYNSSSVDEIAELVSDNSDFCKYLRQDMDEDAVSWLLNEIVAWYYNTYHGTILPGESYETVTSYDTAAGYEAPHRRGFGFFGLVLVVLLIIILSSPYRIRKRYGRWGMWPFVLFAPWWRSRSQLRRRPAPDLRYNTGYNPGYSDPRYTRYDRPPAGYSSGYDPRYRQSAPPPRSSSASGKAAAAGFMGGLFAGKAVSRRKKSSSSGFSGGRSGGGFGSRTPSRSSSGSSSRSPRRSTSSQSSSSSRSRRSSFGGGRSGGGFGKR